MIIFQLTVVGVTGEPGLRVQLIAEEGARRGPEPAQTQPLLTMDLPVRKEKTRSRKIVTKKIVQVKIKLINMALEWQII